MKYYYVLTHEQSSEQFILLLIVILKLTCFVQILVTFYYATKCSTYPTGNYPFFFAGTPLQPDMINDGTWHTLHNDQWNPARPTRLDASSGPIVPSRDKAKRVRDEIMITMTSQLSSGLATLRSIHFPSVLFACGIKSIPSELADFEREPFERACLLVWLN